MNLHMHLQPVPGKGAPVDEAVTMDNTLEKAFGSRIRRVRERTVKFRNDAPV